jgi:hypothetical protein
MNATAALPPGRRVRRLLACALGVATFAPVHSHLSAQAAPPPKSISIAGIRVGMDSAEVHRLLLAENQEFLVHGRRAGQRGAEPGPWLGSIDGGQNNGRRFATDQIAVEFTVPPNARQAVMISRLTTYRPEAEPSITSVRDSLIAQFGAHGVDVPEGLVWHFDSAGRPVRRTTACVDQAVGLYVNRNRTLIPADIDRQATKLAEHEAFAAACGYHVVAHLWPSRRTPNMVGRLYLIIEHAPVRIAGLRATAAMRAQEPPPRRGALIEAIERRRGPGNN